MKPSMRTVPCLPMVQLKWAELTLTGGVNNGVTYDQLNNKVVQVFSTEVAFCAGRHTYT